MNAYRIGMDFKVAPRTVLSFDGKFLYYYKGETDPQLSSFAMAFLPGGGTVELGLPIDTANKSPCAVVPPATSLINSSGTLTNLDCNGYFSYFRNQRISTSTPMERVSLRSNYFPRVELIGSYTYSAANMHTPLNESFDGLQSRGDVRAFTTTGNGNARQILPMWSISKAPST